MSEHELIKVFKNLHFILQQIWCGNYDFSFSRKSLDERENAQV